MTKWARAGVRADGQRPASVDRGRLRARASAELADARSRWERGLVRPWVITMLLDSRRLDGPGVDVACGVKEPTVDLWEAGEVYPTFEQLQKLATLVGVTPAFLVRDHERIEPHTTSLALHMALPAPTPPVERFDTDAIIRTTGVDIRNLPET